MRVISQNENVATKDFTDFLNDINIAGQYALDIGCGLGRNTKALLERVERGYIVDAIDKNKYLISMIQNLSCFYQKNVTFHSIDTIEFLKNNKNKNKYNIILDIGVFNYIEEKNQNEYIKLLFESLHENGVLFMQVAEKDYEFTNESNRILSFLLKKNFAVDDEINYFTEDKLNNLFSPIFKFSTEKLKIVVSRNGEHFRDAFVINIIATKK